MKITTVLAAAGLALGATSSVLADYTFTTIFSGSLTAGSSTSYQNLNLAGTEAIPAGLYSGYEVFVDWQQTAPLNTSQWSNDMRVGFSSTGGSGASLTGALFTTSGGVGPTNGANTNNGGNLLSNLRFAGNFSSNFSGGNPLQLGFRSSFGAATPSTWSNIRVTLKSFVPPAPPAVFTDLGNIGTGNDTMKMGSTAYVPGQVSWFKFTLTQAIPAAVATKWLSIDTYGNSLTGGQFGDGDTEIALFDSTGAVVGNNDDHNAGSGTVSESLLTYGDLATSEWAGSTGTGVDNGALAAGVYYIAVSPYNLNPAAGWSATVSPSGTPVGTLKVSVKIPAPGSMALLSIGGLLATRRRRA